MSLKESIDAISNEERLNILNAARTLGFKYHADASGRLVCTVDQLVEFSAQVAIATVEQLRGRF